MLPMADQASPRPGAQRGAPPEGTDACCGPGEDCCEGGLNPAAATSKTREAGPETTRGRRRPRRAVERTVMRVEGMDCASCAATGHRELRRRKTRRGAQPRPRAADRKSVV